MPVRTNPSLVSSIIEIDEDDDDVTPFILSASMLVDEKCVTTTVLDACGKPKKRFNGVTYDYARLEMIERWLSAHFYCIFRKRAVEEQVASVREKYEFKVDLGLNLSGYGQTAMLLDTNGGLASWNNQAQRIRLIEGTMIAGGRKCSHLWEPKLEC